MSDDGVPMRKLRLHKRPASAAASSSSQQEPGDGPSSSAALSSRVSELIPGIADLSLSSAEQGSGPLDVASAVVQRHQGTWKIWHSCFCAAIACVLQPSLTCNRTISNVVLHTPAIAYTHSPRTSTTR
eukprot:1159885-Pelagomonas_calceolata.AAC.1